jgi:hypothetical protein
VGAQQRLDTPAQFLVAAAGFAEEGRALLGSCLLNRLEEDRLELFRIGRHGVFSGWATPLCDARGRFVS